MKSALEIIQDHAEEGAKLRVSFFAENAHIVDGAALAMARCLAAGGKILVCGNGGSAADAQHMTGELLGRFLMERPSLPAVALTVDTSTLTAIGNDYGYDHIFSRLLAASGKEGDVLVGISTSGNSRNIIEAYKVCKEKGIKIISLTGASGGLMKDFGGILLNVPSTDTPRIQESHIMIGHIICELVEKTTVYSLRTTD